MLSFQQYPAEFGKPTYSEEMHGDEAKKLVSIYAEAVVNADVLEAIRPGLSEALFIRPAQNDSARVGEDGTVHDLIRRFTTMEPVRLTDDWPGYSLTVHGDLIDAAQDWADVEVGKLSIEPQDGGTARLKVRMQMRGEGLEWWVGMMNRSASITLSPPKAEPLPEGHPDAEGDPFAGSDLAGDPPTGVTGTLTMPDGSEHEIDLTKAAARADKAARKRNGAAKEPAAAH